MSHELSSIMYGIDVNKEISLFEYGLLIAPYKKDGSNDEYFCVYSVGNDQFDSGYIHEKELNDLINGNEWADKKTIESFLSSTGQTLAKWLELPMVHKLHDCLTHWGYVEIMGSGFSGSEITKEKALELYF